MTPLIENRASSFRILSGCGESLKPYAQKPLKKGFLRGTETTPQPSSSQKLFFRELGFLRGLKETRLRAVARNERERAA